MWFSLHAPPTHTKRSSLGGGREQPVCQGMLRDAGNKTSPHFPADPCSISLLTWGLVAAEKQRPLKNIRSSRRPLFVAGAVLRWGFFQRDPSPPHHAWPRRRSCSQAQRSTRETDPHWPRRTKKMSRKERNPRKTGPRLEKPALKPAWKTTKPKHLPESTAGTTEEGCISLPLGVTAAMGGWWKGAKGPSAFPRGRR